MAMAVVRGLPLIRSGLFPGGARELRAGAAASVSQVSGFKRISGGNAFWRRGLPGLCGGQGRRGYRNPIQAVEETKTDPLSLKTSTIDRPISTNMESSNIVWHESSIEKHDREKLLNQRGCVIWITGLSGSGKSTLACALSRSLHSRGKLTCVLDGDNVRHGLNHDLSFNAEDRAENIRRIGEVAKLFADSGLICIASLISPYQRDRDACRAILPKGYFIEVFIDIPLELCEARDPKGLYKLARAGRIKSFTGLDDPYERPVNCEIVLRQIPGVWISPIEMAEKVLSYLEDNGYLQA